MMRDRIAEHKQQIAKNVSEECLTLKCPYCYDDDESLYCSAKEDDPCKRILNNTAKQYGVAIS